MTRGRLRLFAASAVVALAVVFLSAAGGQQSPPAMKVIGYYADWTAARYPLADILTIPGLGARMLREFKEYRPYKAIEQFRREIGKYVDAKEVARLERYVTIQK